MVGVVFVGALARGYFDEHSDIDIVVFKERGARLGVPREREFEYKGFLIDYEVRVYEEELRRPWSLEERWAFSKAIIYYDPRGLVAKLLRRKVPMGVRERRRLLVESLRQAHWHLLDYAPSWVDRGDPVSAHHCVTAALVHLARALFALNGELPPPDKWLFNVAPKLGKLPPRFPELAREALLVRDFTAEELERRRAAALQLLEWLKAQVRSPYLPGGPP